MYYNWVMALERPILPFFIYTFTALTILSLLNIWAPARVYAFIVLLPMLGYMLWVWLSATNLWRNYPELAGPRSYIFKEKSYLVEEANKKTPVAYADIARIVESRQALYIMRVSGSADILPKCFLEDSDTLKALEVPWVGSSFL